MFFRIWMNYRLTVPCNDESDEKRVSWKVIVVFTRHNCRLYTVGN